MQAVYIASCDRKVVMRNENSRLFTVLRSASIKYQTDPYTQYCRAFYSLSRSFSVIELSNVCLQGMRYQAEVCIDEPLSRELLVN